METIATARDDKSYSHITCDKQGRTRAADDADDIAECLCCEKPECTNCKQYVYYRTAWKNSEVIVDNSL